METRKEKAKNIQHFNPGKDNAESVDFSLAYDRISCASPLAGGWYIFSISHKGLRMTRKVVL